MPKVGAHVSAAVSLDLSIERAEKIGAEATQIFISPPQQWLQSKHGDEEIKRYKDAVAKTGINANFIHGTYLVNLATQKEEHLQKSIDWLVYALDLAGELGIKGVIFHTGSHGKLGFEAVLDQIVKSIKEILKNSKGEAYLILENSAGQGGSVGSKFSELGAILKAVNSPRLRVCMDTCHAYVSGYNLKTKEGLKIALEEFDREVGLKNLVAIHANDCKFDIGSNKDRHENIGDGFLGKDGFDNLINNPHLKDVPFLLEVPGFAGTGPDKENVDILKKLRND
jgi:deoxyribonuclease IV